MLTMTVPPAALVDCVASTIEMPAIVPDAEIEVEINPVQAAADRNRPIAGPVVQLAVEATVR